MPLFADDATEISALMVVGMIAAPSILLLLCVLDECPVGPKDPLEDAPVLLGFSVSDVFGNATGSLVCFFFVVFVLFTFSSLAGFWAVNFRGLVASDYGGGANVGALSYGYGFVQTHKHGLSRFGSMSQDPPSPPASALSLRPVEPAIAGPGVVARRGLHAGALASHHAAAPIAAKVHAGTTSAKAGALASDVTELMEGAGEEVSSDTALVSEKVMQKLPASHLHEVVRSSGSSLPGEVTHRRHAARGGA